MTGCGGRFGAETAGRQLQVVTAPNFVQVTGIVDMIAAARAARPVSLRSASEFAVAAAEALSAAASVTGMAPRSNWAAMASLLVKYSSTRSMSGSPAAA
jgi:hypothetical protein